MLKTAFRPASGAALLFSAQTDWRPITKLLRVMKLTIVLLTTLLTCTFATGLSQSVTFSGKEVPIRQVFTAIENQTGYVVFSNREILEAAKPVTISASNMPLTVFLQTVMQDQPFEFLLEGKTIVLSPKKVVAVPVPVAAPGRDIPGVILDDKTRGPVRGATVSINGTNKAMQTDERGSFILKGIEEDITITITSIGYEKKLVKVSATATTILATLRIATNELDQTVVQAYGITSKRLATGNITKVTGEEIRRQPVMNPMSALQGRVAGLEVTHLSGNASAPVKLQIRGRNSINPGMLTEPLYVIDGIPQTVLEAGNVTYNSTGVSAGATQAGYSYTGGQSPFFGINPRDIESIEVLKDADATAIYGSRAANGVILITTKKAQPGRTSFEVMVQQGWVTVPRYPNMMSLRDYLDMRYEALKNDGITPTKDNAPDLTLWDTTRTTDWVKELLGTGKNTDINATFSGGDLRTSFRLSAGYTDQVDLYNRSGGNKRGTLHLNLKHTSNNQKFTVNLMASYAASKVDAISDASSGFATAPNAPPIFDEAGNLNFAAYNASSTASHFTFEYILRPNMAKTNSLNSNLSVNYTLLKGLVFSGSLSYQNLSNTNDTYFPKASMNPLAVTPSTLYAGRTNNNNIAVEPQLNYSRSIAKGRLTVMVSGTLQTTRTTTETINAFNFTSDDLMKSINNAQLLTVANTAFDYKYAAVSGRINYNWDQKYILNLQARRDGSSRFAPGRQFGNFGSVGASWIATEEEWLQKVLPVWVSFIKFRGSYGITGSDNVGNYEYLPRYATQQPGSNRRMYTYNGIQPYVSILPVNQDYRWEEQHTLEGGVNLGFLEDRVNVEVAVYRKRSGNQLTNLPTPYYTGFESVKANWDAVVQNSGIEASLRVDIVRKKDLRLGINANISRNVNKLVSYPGIDKSPYATRYRVGESLRKVYVLKLTGVNPLTGDYSFEDYNKDGKITTNNNVFPGTGDDDRYVSYDLNAKYYGGFGTDLTWKQYALLLQFGYSNHLAAPAYMGVNVGRMGNLVLPPDMMDNHWRKPGDIVKYPRFSTMSDFRGAEYVNASYLRLNSMQFSYVMPEKVAKKAGVQSCQFSLNISNLFVITSYGMDPEIQGGSFNPLPRTIVGRLSFTL